VALWVETQLAMLVRAPQEDLLGVRQHQALVVSASGVNYELLRQTLESSWLAFKRKALTVFLWRGIPELHIVVLTPGEDRSGVCHCECMLIRAANACHRCLLKFGQLQLDVQKVH